MGLSHNGNQIYGTHGPIIQRSPDLQVARTKFWGVKGTSEILGFGGGRPLTIESWIHNGFTNPADCVTYLNLLDRYIGGHGDLEVTTPGGIARIFHHVTFEGFDMGPWGILPDQSGTLDGGYWCMGTLKFFQLSVEDDS